jgi:hypothetical protein
VGSNHSVALDVCCCECCALEAQVSETSRSLVQRNPTYCGGVCVLSRKTSSMWWPWPALASNAKGGREGGGEMHTAVYGSSMKQQRIPRTVVCGYETTEEVSVYKPV